MMAYGVRYDPILCDLDGTLADSAPGIVAAIRAACASCGVAIGEGVDLAAFVGPPLEESLAILAPEPELVPVLVRTYREEYGRMAPSTPLLPGVAPTLRSWTTGGTVLAVVTYKPAHLAQVMLTGAGIRGLFRLVVGRGRGRDPRRKADLLREALERLRPHAGVPLYVGDHEEDEAAARACGTAFMRVGPATWTDIAGLVAAGPALPRPARWTQ